MTGASKISSIAFALVALAAAWAYQRLSAPSPIAQAQAPPLASVPIAQPAAATQAPAAAAPASPIPEPPQAATPESVPSPLRALTLGVYQQLRGGPTADACSAAEPALLELLGHARVDSALWNWGMGRARDCLRAPTAFRPSNALLAGLIERFPDHPRVRELAALQHYDSGDMQAAATALGAVAEEADSYEAWETYADAELKRMKELRAANDPAWREALARAESASFRALQLATDATRPIALHTVARTQLELGRANEAIQYAAQAIEAVRAGSSGYQALMAAEMHVFGGQIFYRAGQRDTGLAYMNQGISMAPLAEQRAGLERLRDAFLRIYGG